MVGGVFCGGGGGGRRRLLEESLRHGWVSGLGSSEESRSEQTLKERLIG